jgi:hypothetical protein
VARDPATATLADLAADVVNRGLRFGTEKAPHHQVPILIVTTNEIPGYQITQVHGDVFG